MITLCWHPTNDLPVVILLAWIRATNRLTFFATVFVVGERTEHMLFIRMHGHPFWSIHGRCAHLGRRTTSKNQHFGLIFKSVFRSEAILAKAQLHPASAAFQFVFIDIELSDIQGALFQQITVLLIITGLIAMLGNEFIQMFAAFIITKINHHMAIIINHQCRIFMFKTTKSGTFQWCRVRIMWINFHNPTKAVWLFRVLGYVETRIVLMPLVITRFSSNSVTLLISIDTA
ncbi:Uncharacterised protein [Vibrio cholerae]|nr:Uncharacterised protein [Vibrio cholerae]